MMQTFKRLTLTATILLAGYSATMAEDAATIKILVWNLEHFVDPYDDPYVDHERDNNAMVKSDEELRMLAEAIRIIDADVMAFQEVESDRSLKLFLDTYLPGHEYQYYASTPAMEWYQNVAVVSRLPMGAQTSFREVTVTNSVNEASRREINNRLTAVDIIAPNGYEFTLVNLHLKAGRSPIDEGWRKAQAAVIHGFLEKEIRANPDRNIAVVGDFNAYPDSPEFEFLATGSSVKFMSPFEELGWPYTHSSSEPARVLDHILFNENMQPEYVAGSAAVAAPIAIEKLGRISDHLPIVATIYAEDK